MHKIDNDNQIEQLQQRITELEKIPTQQDTVKQVMKAILVVSGFMCFYFLAQVTLFKLG